MSLRRRVVAGLVAMAALLVLGNVVLARIVESYLLQRVDEQLVDVSSRPVFRGGRGGGPAFDPDQTLSEYFIAFGDPASGSLVSVTSAFADAEQSPPELDADRLLANLSEEEPFTAGSQDGKGEWRLVVVPDARRGVVVVGISLEDVRSTINRIRVVQVGGTLAVLAALGLVWWWMLRLGVHPIEDMARAADAIAGGDLSRRITPGREGTEAARMGGAFNAMLDRIEESFRAREASEERVRRFAADASHELRTPLTSIQGYAELWRAGGLRTKEQIADAMRRMEQEAHRMAALVEDLLLLARLDQGRPVERAPVRLDEIAADGVRDARAVEPDRPIRCDAQAVTVEGDELQLRQIVGNLLANARVHTPAGTPVRVSVSSPDGVARLEVADEGPGMAPEVAAKVFDRFFRADPARARAAGGTGLGLSIVQAVAEAHGGRATVESTPGEGTTFVVELPLHG
ncbi:MAG TPA: HAMP domain-containing sensor histidine kinase [Acidimicrobiales bacterium]|nr:HAMP domain-containing sensor histidine kinase [Acidimicrobiales bacterium]